MKTYVADCSIKKGSNIEKILDKKEIVQITEERRLPKGSPTKYNEEYNIKEN